MTSTPLLPAIDAEFPGGNIVVEALREDGADLHQDLRDTAGNWFYWYFRVRNAAGQRLRFRFTQGPAMGVLGPAASLDGGVTWRWLGREAVDGNGFVATIPPDAGDVRFSFGMPYLEAHLQRFLQRHQANPGLHAGALCRSRHGRTVECLRVGSREPAAPKHRILLTGRHHCCEMMASYALEGILETLLTGTGAAAAWLRAHAEFFIVPFMDKDGVEEGDQGKNRRPHDHNRDYNPESLYPEVAALRREMAAWLHGKPPDIALDLHCPYIGGPHNEVVYLVGSRHDAVWREQCRFAACLERVRPVALPFAAADNLPFGQAWNVGTPEGKSFSNWAAADLKARLASSLEIPYANASGVEVNQDSAKRFGATLVRTMTDYLAAD